MIIKQPKSVKLVMYNFIAGYYHLAASVWESASIKVRLWEWGFSCEAVTKFKNLHLTEIYDANDVYAELSVSMRRALQNSRTRYVDIL